VAYVGSGWCPRLIIFTFSISFRFIAHCAASAKIRNYLDIRAKRLFKIHKNGHLVVKLTNNRRKGEGDVDDADAI
jgi:hypothetical protein